jgi:hypothetical protein
MLPYKRPADCLFSTYTLTSKMLPGEAFLFSEGREALLLGETTNWSYYTGGRQYGNSTHHHVVSQKSSTPKGGGWGPRAQIPKDEL